MVIITSLCNYNHKNVTHFFSLHFPLGYSFTLYVGSLKRKYREETTTETFNQYFTGDSRVPDYATNSTFVFAVSVHLTCISVSFASAPLTYRFSLIASPTSCIRQFRLRVALLTRLAPEIDVVRSLIGSRGFARQTECFVILIRMFR